MNQEFESEHWLDDNANPAGGYSVATGIDITWQNGPLGRGKERVYPNGAFVETLIAIVMDRLEFYQKHFPCRENEIAIRELDTALMVLNARTLRREAAGIEGTHEKDANHWESWTDGTLADQVVPS